MKSNATLKTYTNFILLGFTLCILYALCYFIMRLSLALSAFEDFSLQNALSGDFASMFLMGFRLDMRAICVVFAVFIILGFFVKLNGILAQFTPFKWGGGGLINS